MTPGQLSLMTQVKSVITSAVALLHEGPLTPQSARLFAQLMRLAKGMLTALEQWSVAEGGTTQK